MAKKTRNFQLNYILSLLILASQQVFSADITYSCCEPGNYSEGCYINSGWLENVNSPGSAWVNTPFSYTIGTKASEHHPGETVQHIHFNRVSTMPISEASSDTESQATTKPTTPPPKDGETVTIPTAWSCGPVGGGSDGEATLSVPGSAGVSPVLTIQVECVPNKGPVFVPQSFQAGTYCDGDVGTWVDTFETHFEGAEGGDPSAYVTYNYGNTSVYNQPLHINYITCDPYWRGAAGGSLDTPYPTVNVTSTACSSPVTSWTGDVTDNFF